jgi:hypothetical protein
MNCAPVDKPRRVREPLRRPSWKVGDRIGPAKRGRHRGEVATILSSMGQSGTSSFYLYRVRWADGAVEPVREDVFL